MIIIKQLIHTCVIINICADKLIDTFGSNRTEHEFVKFIEKNKSQVGGSVIMNELQQLFIPAALLATRHLIKNNSLSDIQGSLSIKNISLLNTVSKRKISLKDLHTDLGYRLLTNQKNILFSNLRFSTEDSDYRDFTFGMLSLLLKLVDCSIIFSSKLGKRDLLT